MGGGLGSLTRGFVSAASWFRAVAASAAALHFSSHCLSGMGWGIGFRVFGCRPDLSTLSWPVIPPAFHLPCIFDLHGFVSSLGAVSAKAPHVTHQCVGSLTTMQCFRSDVPAARDASTTLAAQESAALPRHHCGASLLHVSDFALHVEHHHPAPLRCKVWPPLSGFLTLVVVRLHVCGLKVVGPACFVRCRSFLLFAASAAALSREAWVSLSGSVTWLLAIRLARATHMAFVVTSSSCALIASRILKGTRWCSTALFASLSASALPATSASVS